MNFVGTTDNQPLELSANGQPVLRLIPDTSTNNSPDIVGGSSTNEVTPGVVGATIGGGDMNTIGPSSQSGSNPFGDYSSYPAIGASFTTIGGGLLNQIQSNATFSTVAGGALNTIQAGDVESTIRGGFGNTILTNASWSAIAAGTHQTIGSVNGSIGGAGQGRLEPAASSNPPSRRTVQHDSKQRAAGFIGGGYGNTIAPDLVPGDYSSLRRHCRRLCKRHL